MNKFYWYNHHSEEYFSKDKVLEDNLIKKSQKYQVC